MKKEEERDSNMIVLANKNQMNDQLFFQQLVHGIIDIWNIVEIDRGRIDSKPLTREVAQLVILDQIERIVQKDNALTDENETFENYFQQNSSSSESLNSRKIQMKVDKRNLCSGFQCPIDCTRSHTQRK